MISPVGTPNGTALFAAPMQGIRRGVEQLNEAAGKIAEGDISPENVVMQIEASMMVKANAIAARTTNEILGALMDTLA